MAISREPLKFLLPKHIAGFVEWGPNNIFLFGESGHIKFIVCWLILLNINQHTKYDVPTS